MTADDRPDSTDRTPSPRVDVCVVGAGVAGGLVAHSLASDGFDVVVLEAGPRFDPDSRLERMEQALRPDHDGSVWGMGGERDAFTSSGGTEYPLNRKRVKGVGGTTLHWSGYTPRLHEKDFRMESRYGLASDWPITYRDLRPYYAAAERELGVAGAEDNPFGPPREEPYPLPPFPTGPVDDLFETACSELGIALHSAPQARNSEAYDGRSKCLGYSTCSPVCPSGAKYSGDVHIRMAEAEGARVIDRAPVQRLEHDATGDTVEAAVYATPEGTEHLQAARAFVLAAGGIEIPRLLLLSASENYPDGLANSSGLVGEYLMEHPFAGVSGRIEKPPGQEPIYWHTLESHQFYDHDQPRPGSIKLEVNQSSPTPPMRALSGYDGIREELMDPVVSDSLGVDPERSGDGWTVKVEGTVEMLPRRENRVTLNSNRTDDHGNPVPDVSLDVGPHAVETADHALAIGERILDTVGASALRRTDPSEPVFSSHHMGTTRMGVDPTESVVNPQLRTHDLRNLYVPSSSVFVTGGAMNPTLTIAALSLRLAAHLHSRL
jgi:choline dehydrogenase-like flavoprotein